MYLILKFGFYPLFSLIGLIPFKEKGANCDNKEGVQDDKGAKILEVFANEVAVNDYEEEYNVHKPVKVSPVPANHCSEESSDCSDVDNVQGWATSKFPKDLPSIKPGDEDS